MISNPQPLEQLVEILLLQHIVITLEPCPCQALPEPQRADEEKELVRTLDLLNEPRLVNIVTVITAHIDEIHHPIGNPLAVLACVRIYHKYQICSKFTKVERNRNK